MYLLGGRHASEEEEYESASRKQLDRSLASDSQNLLTNSFKPIKSALKKSSPSLAPTEEASDNESFQSALDCYDRHNDVFDAESTFGRKKKELSWSDHSGLNLVEYVDAQPISATRESSMESSSSAGSGLTRSRSIRHQMEENQVSAQRDRTSFLPRMTPHGGGIVMPTMHSNPHQSTLNGGIESPQWGWYYNHLTPPSPEMYTAHQYPRKPHSGAIGSTAASNDSSKSKRTSCTKPNPIFQSLPSQRKDRATRPTIPV